ncbi:membrane protein [Isoalcanivorax pacificus W11-5]|uniref:Membrane protein n=1 Tax=Isoalcanivorax pacificus W11-5 TaxID=391936 RepID=A0A0B4XLU6_9GAMM|nr:TlpA disulfide reductase family protein [Isoalcanivorax pacificus]AJD47508.1 membrane protein [Isoalcanivorax pacificus W11-5]
MLSVSLGPLVMSVQRGLLVLAVLVALMVAMFLARQRRVPVADAVISVLGWGVLGARLVFVVRYWSDYAAAPWSIVDIRDGGFDPLGGVLAAVLYAGWVGWRRAALRRPLAIALGTGVGVWLLSTVAFLSLENTARELPAVPLATLSGGDTSLAARHDGRPMVVNLWATWCPPCRREMPVLEVAQQARPDVQFVFVNQREPLWTVQQFLMQQSLQLTNVVLDTQGELSAHVGSFALPTTLFYDAGGKLVDSHLGEVSHATLRHALQRLAPSESSEKE